MRTAQRMAPVSYQGRVHIGIRPELPESEWFGGVLCAVEGVRPGLRLLQTAPPIDCRLCFTAAIVALLWGTVLHPWKAARGWRYLWRKRKTIHLR